MKAPRDVDELVGRVRDFYYLLLRNNIDPEGGFTYRLYLKPEEDSMIAKSLTEFTGCDNHGDTVNGIKLCGMFIEVVHV